MDHIQLICDIGEINEVFTDVQSIEAFLQKIVEMVARHMDAAVCSIYLYDEDRRELVLKATKGLNRESIGKVKMKLGEGLTGLALKELRPIYERIGRNHPGFKYFPGTSEERYDPFLAVPILRGLGRIGVLVVQRGRNRIFRERDIVTLRAVASQLANMLENARLFMTLQLAGRIEDKKGIKYLKLVKGKVASDGFALGPARIIDRDKTFDSFLHRAFPKVYTGIDFQRAVAITERQLEQLQARVEEKLSDVASLIFTAHLLLLKDKEFIGAMIRKIDEGVAPPEAVLSVAKRYVELFTHASNPYIQEKVQDIEDLTIRLLGNLVEELRESYRCESHVVIARELFPSDLLMLSSENALGVVLVTGGVTSHLSILARSLQLPLVIIDSTRLLSIPDETPVLLDAEVGNLYVNPSPTIVANYRAGREARRKVKALRPTTRPETVTKDGVRIRLMANINLLSDLKLAREVKCEGIGLYRTEFPFLIRSDFPSEEEQYVIYRQLIEGLPGKQITFRTLDIGGDKVLSYYDVAREHNPFLGMRSIRFSLNNRDLFFQQIRAMLRAGAGAEIRISFPMISSVEEFLSAKAVVLESLHYLKEKRIPHNAHPVIGMMAEVPSALAIIDELAQEVDFFSIGTNDLVQYLLAVDRTNEKVAPYYQPHHPSVLRSIKKIVEAAGKFGKSVSVCGDMAHRERFLSFFVGAGVNELSLDAAYLPRVQEIIEKIDSRQAADFASKVLNCSKASDTDRLLK